MKRIGDIIGLTGSTLACLSGAYMLTDKDTILVGFILLSMGLIIAGSTLRGMGSSKK